MYRKRLLLFISAVLLVGSMSACQAKTSVYQQIGMSGLGVDTRFLEFYEQLGGKDVLSIAISPKFTHNGREYQYTAAVLMVYDPLADGSQQYYLAPIGVEMGIAEPPTAPGQPGGHDVFQGFQPLYNDIGGRFIMGAPLTSVRYNEERGGVEQFFENAGLFQLEGDPANEIQLIHYGAWMCADSCNFDRDPVFAPLLPNIVETPFAHAISRLDPAFIGKPLTEPYISTDGQVEQIFENVVVVAAPEKPAGIALRPITAMLGVPVQLEEQFETPAFFREFISRNSGLEFSGPAVTDYDKQSEEVFRQCFSNLCLDYYPQQAPDLQIRLTPLGYVYKSRFYLEVDPTPTPVSSQKMTMKVFKGYGLVAPNTSQVIIVQLFQGYQPVAGLQPELTLMLPGGAVQSLLLPPTQSEGRTSLELDPISATHGTRIDYRVCINHQGEEKICIDDHYLIWGSP
jgi:hypothetical protein